MSTISVCGALAAYVRTAENERWAYARFLLGRERDEQAARLSFVETGRADRDVAGAVAGGEGERGPVAERLNEAKSRQPPGSVTLQDGTGDCLAEVRNDD